MTKLQPLLYRLKNVTGFFYTQQFRESVTKGVADGDAGHVISTEELERQFLERRKRVHEIRANY